MPHQRQVFGQRGEAQARDFLIGLGYTVVAENWHAGRYGELDLVALDGGTLVFVEVKTRRGTGFGRPEEAVNAAKQAKLRLAAEAFRLAHPHLPQEFRFDVVAISGSVGSAAQVDHFRGVFC